jgi:hypothetical protein
MLALRGSRSVPGWSAASRPLSTRRIKIAEAAVQIPYNSLTARRYLGIKLCIWCERGDSNPHGFTRQILSLVRLPIPPLSQSSITSLDAKVRPLQRSYTQECLNPLLEEVSALPTRVGNLFPQLRVGCSRFHGSLGNPSVEFSGDPLLFGHAPCFLQSDRHLIRRHAQEQPFGPPGHNPRRLACSRIAA